MTTVPHPTVRWRNASTAEDTCVDLAANDSGYAGLIRDSKNPSGPTLRADLAALLGAVQTGRFDR